MNRNEEYKRLMQELDAQVPAVENTLTRAKAKNRRRKRVVRPLAGLAAVFACFVILVNFCAPVAYACSKVPILRELAEVVTFSHSLTDAVENEYVQTIDLQQTDNGVTAKIEYLIVDQKQINVFYRLESDKYPSLAADPDFRAADGSRIPEVVYGVNSYEKENGELRCSTIEFIEGSVPDSIMLILNVRSVNGWDGDAAEPVKEALLDDHSKYTPDYAAHFEFVLKFDPLFTETGNIIEINQTVTIDEQQLKLTDMEIYPTHLRLNVEDVSSNTAWLKRLDFYIETDWGMKFDVISNGLTATGSADSPMMVSYRADSTYFYEANHLKFVITGAEWLDKDMESVHLNLATGEADRMPDGTQIYDVARKGDSWIIAVRAEERNEDSFHQIFMGTYYYPDGSKGDIDSWSASPAYGEYKEAEGYFYEIFPIKNYPCDEVWLVPVYSHEWFASEPIDVIVY